MQVSTGQIGLSVGPDFPLKRWVEQLQGFGYRLGPDKAEGDPAAERDPLLLRLGICLALAGNSMLLSTTLYLGLDTGPLATLFQRLNLLFAALSVAIGGSVFFQSAWQSWRKRALHLDVPIALGIALSFSGSLWAHLEGRAQGVYFDSVSVFIALMLLGRWLRERVVRLNRRWLLRDPGTSGLLGRVLRDGRLTWAACETLEVGETLWVPAGELLPVDAVVHEAAVSFSLDWMQGESEPRRYEAGETIRAGAFNAGGAPAALQVAAPFRASELARLLTLPAKPRARSAFWHRLGAIYVIAVITLAAAAFAWRLLWGDGWEGALEATVAVLVVSCPCAFGLALPLATEMAHVRLRRHGLFVRRPDMLERLADVRQLVFDKTGTLTTMQLEVLAPERLTALPRPEAAVWSSLCSLSAHPKSRAVVRALQEQALPWCKLSEVHEEAGQGLSACFEGRNYRVGSADFCGVPAEAPEARAALHFSIDGVPRMALEMQEHLRPDAAAEFASLQQAGFGLWLLSGDQTDKTRRLARRLGLDEAHAIGDQSPRAKADWLRTQLQAPALFVGDGINDVAAVRQVQVAGTPAIERPYVASRCDFFYTTEGLHPIRLALHLAQRLRRLRWETLSFALLYNLGALIFAFAGSIEPWMAAVLMPLSSLSVLGWVLKVLGGAEAATPPDGQSPSRHPSRLRRFAARTPQRRACH
ncbi:MAG: heavy metal translocating P-type ATPase [Polyangiales bacterium]